jgi:hypothetical protein
MSDTLAGLLMQEQARSVRLEAERNRWAELAGEKEGEITTLRERLAEAERLVKNGLLAVNDSIIGRSWMRQAQAFIGTADSADVCPEQFGPMHCVKPLGHSGKCDLVHAVTVTGATDAGR